MSRTLLDLAAHLRVNQLERAFDEAERIRLLDLRAIERLCLRTRGHPGVRPLRALIATHAGTVPETRSNLERRFLELCRGAGLPVPAVNVVVADFEVDAVWQASGLVVELDGFEFHRTRDAFERDRARDVALQLAGYRVLRITHRRLATEPKAVAEAVRSLLAPSGSHQPVDRP